MERRLPTQERASREGDVHPAPLPRPVPDVPPPRRIEPVTQPPDEPRATIRPRGTAAASPAKGPAAAPAPTIHVSIGRVEVRAVQPPVKPRRRAERPAPLLSLDDYLKRHGRSG